MSRKRKIEYVDHVRVRKNPIELIVELITSAISWLKRFFAFRNIKQGMRFVTSSFGEFSTFIIAVFLLQVMFWTTVLALDSREATIKAEAYQSADYHIRISGLTTQEWASIENDNFYVANHQDIADRLYVSYTPVEYTNFAGDRLVSVDFLLPDDELLTQEQFFGKYHFSGANISVGYSERAEYLNDISVLNILSIVLLVVFGLLAVAVLLVLYNIRINHFKFKYGVFMSFGADYEKLLHTCAWELICVAALTAIPAFLVGLVIGIAHCSLSGGVFSLDPLYLFYYFIWTVSVVLLAVLPSVRVLADKTPISLITAGDNSNYVSSPRASFRIFRKSFPIHYELFGFWRFRKYYATLLISSILFTSLFLCGGFVNNMVSEEESHHSPQYSLVGKAGAPLDEGLISSIIETEGISHVLWENSVSASEISALCILTAHQRAGISSKTVKSKQDGMYADNNYKYVLLDELLCAEARKEGAYKIQGDLSKVLDDSTSVAVTQFINNEECMHFEVGDEIILGRFKESLVPIKYDKLDKKYILSQLVKEGIYEYYTVTVAAVVDSYDNDDEYSIFINPELFATLVGRDINTNSVDIYTKQGISYEESDRIFELLIAELGISEAAVIRNLYANVDYKVNQSSSFSIVILIAMAALLLVSPLIWFFSQSMFCGKREKENSILSAFGASDSQLGKMYMFSGAALTIPASIITVLLGIIITRLGYWAINEFLTSLGLGSEVRFAYVFSITGAVICVSVSLICAVLSTYLPFIRWMKNRDKIIQMHNGGIVVNKEEEDAN